MKVWDSEGGDYYGLVLDSGNCSSNCRIVLLVFC